MNKIQNYLEETEKEFEEKIFKIVSRIIGTAIQEGTITGKYSDDFARYRKEILELFSNYQIGLIELVKELVPEEKEIWREDEIGKVGTHAIGSNQNFGFNSCRSQFLKNLKS